MSTPETADDEQPPEYAKGGPVLGPDGEDSVRPWFGWFDPRWERIFTAEQVRRFMAAEPGSRDALPLKAARRPRHPPGQAPPPGTAPP